jgi:hypothetical protein
VGKFGHVRAPGGLTDGLRGIRRLAVQNIVEVPNGYPTSTIFIDESRGRASGGRFFAVAAVKVRKPGALARSLQSIREPGEFKGEFKFKSVTTGTLPRYYAALQLLDSPDAQVHACVVDAEQHGPFGKRPFWRVHADIVCQLLVGSINKRELVAVLIDRISTPAGVAYEDIVKEQVNRRLGATSVVACICLDSRTNDLMQLADLVAGLSRMTVGYRSRPTAHGRRTRRRL